MCGGGSVPLEAALSFPGCLFIGTDMHTKALERCSENKVRLDYSATRNTKIWNIFEEKVKLNSVDTSASWLFLCKTVWLVEIYVSYAWGFDRVTVFRGLNMVRSFLAAETLTLLCHFWHKASYSTLDSEMIKLNSRTFKHWALLEGMSV